MQTSKKRRAPRTTNAQYALMLDFCSKHNILLNSRQSCNTAGTAKEVDKLWSKLATALNNCGSGASKSVDQWKRTWVEWKSNTKRRCREVLVDQKNGVKVRGLTELEQRLMDLISTVSMENNHLDLTSTFEEEKHPIPLEALEMVLEKSDSNMNSTDFSPLKTNNNNTDQLPTNNPNDWQTACSVISSSLNGVALAIRELAASQFKMAEANIKLAEVIIHQMQITKK